MTLLLNLVNCDCFVISPSVDSSRQWPPICSNFFVVNCGLPARYSLCTYHTCTNIAEYQVFYFDASCFISLYRVFSFTSIVVFILYYLLPRPVAPFYYLLFI